MQKNTSINSILLDATETERVTCSSVTHRNQYSLIASKFLQRLTILIKILR